MNHNKILFIPYGLILQKTKKFNGICTYNLCYESNSMPSKGYSEKKKNSLFSLLKQKQTKTLNTSFLSCLKRK